MGAPRPRFHSRANRSGGAPSDGQDPVPLGRAAGRRADRGQRVRGLDCAVGSCTLKRGVPSPGAVRRTRRAPRPQEPAAD